MQEMTMSEVRRVQTDLLRGEKQLADSEQEDTGFRRCRGLVCTVNLHSENEVDTQLTPDIFSTAEKE